VYTKQALHELGVTSRTLTEAQTRQFDELGYFIVENVLSPEDCEKMRNEFERIHAAESDKGGHEVHVEPGARRISNVFNKTDAFDKCLWIPEVLAASAHALGEIKVHGANIRDPATGHGNQDLHADVPKKFADDWWVVNSMIMFDDMTLDNGPTRIVPGSHRWAPINVPYVNIGDWEPAPLTADEEAPVPKDLAASYPGEVLVEAPAGSAIICNSSMWHAGTMKKTGRPRRMLHLTYTRRDLPQQLLQLDYLTPELYNRMSPVKRYLLEIEPPKPGDGVLRQPKKDHQGWWN
jgi:ectoine hydroxylase-related dioxygenase (phytanoyl-CoA dioxygenase family)